MFGVPDDIPDSPSHRAALDVAPLSVLDVGCGGGIAAFAVVPPATVVIGVDHQQEMLDMFQRNAAGRGVQVATHLGFWPAIASEVGSADVVTSHHVVYNVPDIVPFLTELARHAHRRVVLELPTHHPLSTLTPAWRQFWDLDRPTTPTSGDLVAVLREMGFDPQSAHWEAPTGRPLPFDEQVAVARTRLCLPESRDQDVADFLRQHPMPTTRDLTAIWWDV